MAIVRYSPQHNVFDEWVYNSADLDNSKVIWAREMDVAENEALLRYYRDRKAWLVQPDDTEGLIDYIRAIDGVIAAAFFDEIGDGRVRVSLRSKSPRINVSKVCGLFGGGGHTLAAGARVRGTLAEVQERVLQAIDHEFDQP